MAGRVPMRTAGLAASVQRLQAEVEGLRRGQRHRAVIEQAKGLLMGRLGIAAAEAFSHLAQISQRSNIPVVEVAAGLLGVAAPLPDAIEHADGDGFVPNRYVTGPNSGVHDGDGPAPPAVYPLPEELTARYHLVCATLEAVTDPAGLAEVVRSEGLCPFGVTAVLLGVLEPDGAVRLVSADGLPAGLASAWQRVPSTLKVAFLRPMADGRPLWIDRAAAADLGYQLLGDGDLRACLPLRDRGRVFGVASIIWAEGRLPDPGTQAYVTAVADAAGRRLAQLLRQGEGTPLASPAAHWVEAVLEVLPGSFALIAPVRDHDGAVVDFCFDRCSPEAVDAVGRTAEQVCGRRVLDLYPRAVSDGVFDGYVHTLQTGEPYRLPPTLTSVADGRTEHTVVLSTRAARFGDGLLVHWRYHDAEQYLRSHLERLQRAADAGWAEWDLIGRATTWSPQTYRILRRDPAQGPIKLSSLPRHVTAEHAPALTTAIQRLTDRGESFDLTVRLRRGGVESLVRIVADAVRAPEGEVIAVHAAVNRVHDDGDGRRVPRAVTALR